MRRTILLGVIFQLVGCANITYTQPSGPERTLVQFRGNRPFGVYVYDDAACMVNEQRAVQLPHPPYQMAKPLSPDERSEVLFSTSKSTHLLFRGVRFVRERPRFENTLQVCGVPVDYQFQKDRKYEAFDEWNGGFCEVKVYEVVADSSSRQELAKFTSGLSEKNKGCFAATAKRRE